MKIRQSRILVGLLMAMSMLVGIAVDRAVLHPTPAEASAKMPLAYLTDISPLTHENYTWKINGAWSVHTKKLREYGIELAKEHQGLCRLETKGSVGLPTNIAVLVYSKITDLDHGGPDLNPCT